MESDNMYLDAMNQLNDKFKENEKIVNECKEKTLYLKKQIMTIYGIIRLIDNGFDNDMGNTAILMEMLRGLVSEIIEEDILEIPKINIIELDL
jgi:asparagine synthetase A|tara:strand:+ start:367 stop:645 length:279 start_codon:yes stop_codon:yes gene_type:complete